MFRIIICTNEYPYQLLSENATEEFASELCKQLNNYEEEFIKKNKHKCRIYYDYSKIEESDEFKPVMTGNY